MELPLASIPTPEKQTPPGAIELPNGSVGALKKTGCAPIPGTPLGVVKHPEGVFKMNVPVGSNCGVNKNGWRLVPASRLFLMLPIKYT